MMWHEARKQEKKIRGMIVDYHRRAERRRDYYEKIKADPTQFLQIHGRPVKVHLDPAVAMAGDSPANMMPWQGRTDTLIDRFDVRAHLDFIPDPQSDEDEESISQEERQANYERYRILVQNEFLAVSEEKFLHQLFLEEQFGPIGQTKESKEPPPNPDKKGKKVPGAAIGYNYEDDSGGNTVSATMTPVPTSLGGPPKVEKDEKKLDENAEEEDDDSDMDFDMCLDVSKIGTQQAHEMNRCGLNYGMTGNDFFSFLTDDMEEQEALKLAREQEEEKAMFAGRKSRRERRAFREKKLVGRKISPPSYATRSSPTYDPYRKSPKHRSKSRSQSRSRSASPVNTGVIQYITSFGDEEDATASGLAPPTKASSVAVTSISKQSRDSSRRVKKRSYSSSSGGSSSRRHHRRSKSRSRSHSRSHSRSRSRTRRRKRSPSSSRDKSRSRSRSSRSRSRSRSHSKTRARNRSRTSRSRSKSSSRNRSRNARRRRSRTTSSSRSRSRSRSRKRSLSSSCSPVDPRKKTNQSDSTSVPSQPVQRYYGRRKGNSSSSELDISSDEDSQGCMPTCPPPPTLSGASGGHGGSSPNKSNRSGFGNSRPAAKMSSSANMSSGPRMTPQERLKKKMQALLNRQYKADKKAEKARQEKAEQERMDREEELREMAIKMRRRERQKRHRMRDGDQDDDGSEQEDRSQWSSDSSDSGSDKGSPSRSARRSQSPESSEYKQNRWDATATRLAVEEKRSMRDETRRDDRSRQDEIYKRQDSHNSRRDESIYRRDDNHSRDDSSTYRRDDVGHRRDGGGGGGYRRDNGNNRREDSTSSGPSRYDSANRREYGNRRNESTSFRGRDDGGTRGGKGEWNRKEDDYPRSRYDGQRSQGGRRQDVRHGSDDRKSDSSRPKLVDY